MYCYHCGYEINSKAIEAKSSSYSCPDGEEIDFDAKISYVCPRCGHLIHEGCTHEEKKELSRASHAQIQRGSNNLAMGMSLNSIGIIAFIIAFLFYTIAKKPANGFQLDTSCTEFYVAVILFTIALILLVTGITLSVLGALNKRKFERLLKDLNNETFVQ